MIGTVVGFIIMIQCFNTFDPNTGNVMKLFTKVSTGLGTALYTTATGLVCSLALKLQLRNLEDCIAKQT
jgi:biopolymer transport protein ExbB/TolQ